MKKIITLFSLSTLIFSHSFAQNNVSFLASDNWIAYMNVFDLAANGGAYQFGSPWALPDVKSTPNISSNTLLLQPNFNTYAANTTDSFWVNQTTLLGNKDMEALTFVEPGATFNGQDLTFSGKVLSNTLAAGYTAQFFIKALDPANGYSDALNGTKVLPLPTSGNFTVSATAAQLPAGLLVQYGFIIRGANANPANEISLGGVLIGAPNAGINDLENVNVSVCPNPANEVITINADEEVIGYEIVSVAGQVATTGRNTNGIDISGLDAGTYFVRVNLASGVSTHKLIKN
jgi:hypothetical protein